MNTPDFNEKGNEQNEFPYKDTNPEVKNRALARLPSHLQMLPIEQTGRDKFEIGNQAQNKYGHNVLTGYGAITYGNEDESVAKTYIGNFQDGQLTEGKFFLSNGESREGHFVEGNMLNGYGKRTEVMRRGDSFIPSTQEEGMFERDYLVIGNITDLQTGKVQFVNRKQEKEADEFQKDREVLHRVSDANGRIAFLLNDFPALFDTFKDLNSLYQELESSVNRSDSQNIEILKNKLRNTLNNAQSVVLKEIHSGKEGRKELGNETVQKIGSLLVALNKDL